MREWLAALVGVVLLIAAGPLPAQVDPRAADAEMFPADVIYNPAIPTPADFLGFELGHEPVRHHQLVEYITRVAELSDRLSVEVIGHTHERRPILFVVATSTDNRARLDEIKTQHAALSNGASNSAISDDMPIVTWLNYGVHGAEASGMDSSLPFIYYLAAAQGSEIDRVLGNSVILVTAIFNPDGHNQRVAWYDAYGGQQRITDPAHIEHQGDWTFARTNHYWFDLNRQWLLLTQPEPRAWMRKWHEWRPNLTVDYHEMGGQQTYYFHPGVATRTNPLAPERAEELMEITVKTSEDFLDAEGRLYFHGERFDNFYIGKGSTFPLLNGGVGVLYEAGATLGRELDTANGLRTFRENIRKHFRTSIAGIVAGANLRREYLEYQQAFYNSALSDAARYPVKAWVVSAPGDPARMHFFADLLNSHRIETHKLTRDITVDGTTFPAAESLIVPASQAQHRLIRSVFETLTEFEDETFYDVSTWTLPPAFGLDAAPLAGKNFRDNLVGEAYAPPLPVADAPDKSHYGYVFEWGPYYAPRALWRALDQGMLARVATKSFSATTARGVREFSAGAIVVPFDRQEVAAKDIHELARVIAAEDGIPVHALTSGRSAIGTRGIDIGGASFTPLKRPSVLLVMGDGVAYYDAGEVWHLADVRMQMPVTLRWRETLGGIEWDKYTHIVFPSGDYEEYEPEYAGRLRQWIAEGGTAIAMREAAPWLRATTLDWIDPLSEQGLAAAAAPAEDEEDEVEEPGRLSYSEKDDYEAHKVVGGAIFRADLDTTHPLGFGFARRDIFLHKNVEEPLEPTDNPFGTVIAYTDDPVYSGFVSDENSAALAGTPSLIAERSGDGSIILFADNPNFRGYWYGTNKLFLNAIFFSKVFEAPAED
jgi:hypothetical protein